MSNISMVGTVVRGRYEIKEEFIKCRFSVLYKAMDKVSNRVHVLRVFNDKMAESPQQAADCRMQMRLEGNLLSTLYHRHLPQALEVFEEGANLFILMDNFEGDPADKFIKSMAGQIQEHLLLKFLNQMINVVGYLHEQSPPVIVGGISPEGIIVDRFGSIMLVEFGLATVGSRAIGKTNLRVLGNPFYIAPEQLKGELPDPRNDIYSMGALLYFMATGKQPRKSMDRLKSKKQDQSVSSINPGISDDMASIIAKMMEVDKDSCYSNFGELQEEVTRKFPINIGMSVAVPDLMQKMVEVEERGGAVDLESTVFSVSPDSFRVPPPQLVREMPGKKMEIQPAKEEEELVLEEVEEEEPGKKKFQIGRLLHHSFWFGPSKQEGRVAAPDFTTPGSAFLMQYPSIELSLTAIDRDLAQILPQKVAKVIYGVVVDKGEGNEIKVAVKDPSNVHIYDQIAFATEGKYRPILYRADPNMIDLAQEFVYSLPAGTHGVTWFEWLEKKKYEHEEIDVKQDAIQAGLFDKEDIEGPVIEESNKIIKEAISIGASDIHLEAFEKETVLRYRIDGVLHIMNSYQPEVAKAIIKRLKITANMDIAQERVPQGGRISVKVSDREFDLRVSLIPVPHGESIVMRLLNKGAFHYKLEDLGFEPESLELFRGLLSKPHGMILVSGPTGSGKSTTLYASLKEIARPDRKLLTVEDPIEYEMPGICQVQVNMAPREEEKRVTFARALREFLRQDPDVILVGEIRDSETASISVQAALTGHLLLSTIHTNDSVGIVTRLRDMGVAPYLIGSILNGGIAQRLVRRICPKCKERVEPTAADIKMFQEYGVEIKNISIGKGCLACHGVGYKGRLGVYEIFKVTSDIGELISTGSSVEEIRRMAVSKGMKMLMHDALVKASKGEITMGEVSRITMG